MIDSAHDLLAHSGAKEVRDVHRRIQCFHESLGDLPQLD
jgi:hypothetical protein